MFPQKKRTVAITGQKSQQLIVSGRTEAIASSAQQRIYMHENLSFSASDFSVYNYVIPLIIKRGSVPIEQIRLSLVSVMQQHTILRTAIRINPIRNQIEQNIQPLTDDIYSFQHSRDVSTSKQFDHLLTNESIGKYFDVENGKVLRCHVVQRSADGHDDLLHEGDLIIFVIHHIAFDLSSYKPFLKAFERACWVNEYQQSVLTVPQYIDFALYEHALLADTKAESKMNRSRLFWANLLHGYDWNRTRNLVFDEDRTNRLHSGRGYSTAFIINQDVIDSMMLFASTNNVTMFSLSLACYYAFLFKLINHNDDLCVVSSAANRSVEEIQDMIGMFVNLVLYRVKIERNNTFEHLVKQVQKLSKEVLVHNSLPYQQIIESKDKRENNSLPSAFFQYEPLKLAVAQKNSIELTLSEGSVISGYYDRDLNHQSGISLFDISLTIIHDHQTPSTECFLNCSADIFKHQNDVDQLSERFQHILTQLFLFPMPHESIQKLTILLPNEQISLSESSNTKLFSYDPSTCTILKSSTINQQMSMTSASIFWLDALHNCQLDQPLSLPFDRYRLANKHRTGLGTSISFDFGQDLSHDFLTYASSNNISLEHLTFAIYFIFLFKLTNGQTDLCLAMNTNNNRYRDELKSIIGLLENIIPLRCQLDPHWSFHQLLEHVQEITINSMKYSYFPLQRILNQHPHISKHAFLDTSLEFLSYMKNNTEMIGDSQLVPGSFSFNINEDEILSAFDFSLCIYHDTSINQLSCTINASVDLLNRETMEKISQRFHYILHQLSTSIIDNQINKPIHELSIILSNEQYLMQSMNNTQTSFSSSPLACIHHEFVYQVMKHPQKLAVELDEQSLTYCELLYYVQVLSLTLLNEYHVLPGEIVCQCVERSLSMVIGIMGIEMAGGVYCPLSPRDPQHRLHALVQQTQSRLVLVHYLTKTKFNHNIVSSNIDSILPVYNMERNIDIDQLSNITVTLDDLAYIIFTSGSTGVPKAVQVRHKNFTEFMYSLIYGDVVNKNDTILQIARCSFDVHVQDILGTFMIGSSLIMLHPRGIMDFDYLASVFKDKNVTCITTVPTIISNFFTYLQQQNHHNVAQYLRSVCSGGEACSLKLINLMSNTVTDSCRLWNMYGPAETTIDCTFHLFHNTMETERFPIGRPLSNYQNLVLDQFLESVFTDQEGELFVGGVGVFAGYLGRNDLTAKALVEIDGQLFYRTGDLVTMDKYGLIHYQGRKDHQIKLHGQRIELGEIERCLLNITSISACVVIKWNDDYLVAYVQSSHISEEQLREHCQSHLPPHMIPSIFIILDKLPLNPNGKVDRKRLPSPNFSLPTGKHDGIVPRNILEQQLQDIFSQAFHIESPHVEVSFGQLGGTSLNAILALTLIRQQICNKVDIGLLFNNPSIRQLAQAIKPLLVFEELQETASIVNEIHEIEVRLTPSFVVESLCIVLLVCQWWYPIMIIHQWCPLFLPVLPIYHLLFYVICSRLLSSRNIKDDNIFSWNYYRWWFLDRIWNNNTFWLQHILGTPLYNYYLRLCGARVSLNAHIYTTTMDAPWLLDIGDATWIADKTTLNCLYFNDDYTFALHSIRIGCYCSISTRSILFGGVDMQDNIIVQPMSSVTGFIESRTIIDGDEHKSGSSDISITHSNRLLSIWHKIYQVITIISLICIHCTLLAIAYKVYSVEQIPLPISIAFCWTLWSIIACFVTLFLLKFVVGSCAAGEIYPIASWSYLHKVWLRQLIVSSFHHAWLLPTGYDYLYPFILRWLGAQVEDDVKLANIDIFLSYPTNLLKLERGVTTFGYVLLVPTEMTLEGDHRADWITLGSYTNLANGCSILPGSHLTSHTMVGNLTRITRETNSNYGDVFIGVPARAMPFQMPFRQATEDQIKTIPFWKTCFSYYISKCLLIGIYWSCGLVSGPIIHTIIVCSLYRWYSYADNKVIKQIIGKLQEDHRIFICSFLGNTQWLIRFFRAYGANIGNNVIIPDVSSLFDYDLVTIGDHVRLNINAHIVCHTFEQRILKLVPVTVGNSCILMSGSIVMSGCKLMGNNRLYPFTLVMKNDLLQPNTQWRGLPAQSYVAKPVLSRSAPICDDVVKCKQKSKNFDRLFLWNEQISNVYTNVNELQFMNWGYADLDEYINDNTGYYSEKLYQQILANITLTDQNILEVGCGRGAGAAWCVRTYAPRSYVGMDPSRNVINLCEQTYSTTPRLSFMIADPKTHLPFQNESMNIVLSIETTNLFDEIEAVKKFVDEITRVLTSDGYFLWCGLCNVDGSSLLIDYLTANNGFIIKEKVNITRNVLHALDIQSNSRADFINRYIQSADQEYCRLLAGLPGTELYDNMQQGRTEYWRVVFRKKTTKKTHIV
ncbi:unnamed protein product [Adineta steineri]|uniref:Carrier domain-containing protein n=1 Tax=Adineta steineri TaxID=433720 RepID=A0A819RUK0_9BILA|nr:unnamed protein product [Adineta steineri]